MSELGDKVIQALRGELPIPDSGPVTEIQVMEDVLEDWTAKNEEDEKNYPFVEILEEFYGNLADDLHDSKGDPDYQQGVLERMQIVERWIATLGTIQPVGVSYKNSETTRTSGARDDNLDIGGRSQHQMVIDEMAGDE